MSENLQNNSCETQETNLTRSQLLIWTGQQLNPDSPLYNMAKAFKIKGHIDIASFKKAFQWLVESSDALRTVFTTKEGLPNQKVEPNLAHNIEFVNWTDHPNAQESITKWLNEQSQKSFDTSKILFDAVLHKIKEDEFVWYFNQHHLITDGWSVAILFKKMSGLYEKALKEDSSDIKPLPLFQEYRKHELKLRASSRRSVQNYWESKLQTLAPKQRLYGCDSQANSSDSERTPVSLGAERTLKLKEFAKDNRFSTWTSDLTLFNIFSTVLTAFLYRTSEQNKICFGTPAHNRIKPEYKETSGLFIELFPLSIELDGKETFISLFKKVQIESFDFLKYAQPGAAFSELSRSFNVVLNYINAGYSQFAGMDMSSDWVHPNHADQAHVLRLQVHDFDQTGQIQLLFDLNTTVFNAEIRKQISADFLAILDAFINSPEIEIGQSPLNTNEHLKAVTQLEIKSAPYEDVIQQFEKQATLYRRKVALQSHGNILTFEDLNTKANKLARHLKINVGDRIAIHLKRTEELIISVLAILKAGACYIPIDVQYSKTRIQEILSDSKPHLVLSSCEIQELLPIDIKAKIQLIDYIQGKLERQDNSNLNLKIDPDGLAYIMYTSGSTGLPKGVMVSRKNLAFYISWAKEEYNANKEFVAPLFTSTGFDLTVTSLFLPLVSGGKSIVFTEPDSGPDMSVFEVMENKEINFIKLTPSHLSLLKNKKYPNSSIQTIVVGGEDFKATLAKEIYHCIGQSPKIINEYGPTEATVGCVFEEFNPNSNEISVPIGEPIKGCQAYLLDGYLNKVPVGLTGEIYIVGPGVTSGYWQQDQLTAESFTLNPFEPNSTMYKTGDLAKMDSKGRLHYVGRKDEQVKIGGRRIELGEIENALSSYSGISDVNVQLRTHKKTHANKDIKNCLRCGIPSNYPNITFDHNNVCSLCSSFEDYQRRVQKYFKTPNDLLELFDKSDPAELEQGYDCIALLSGGKDSTYALAKLVDMGLRVLAFTLDNGYISEQAKQNINRVVYELGVDHVYGSTPAMNEIFVDSLLTHCNVCDGCFKTIYTLSMKVALEKKIPYIVTGLSRGQFFETRLTEELFNDENADMGRIDEMILQARKSYHRVDDAVKRSIDVSAFENDEVFDKVKFLDFYRYTDVSLDEMLAFLDDKLSWIRPTDTGRSTNCLINQAGIYVHKKERGYSNYAFPYSWDVRLGHKTRNASLEEINEEIDEKEVSKILKEIGYEQAKDNPSEKLLVAYYSGSKQIEELELKRHLETTIPSHMIPSQFIHLEKIPLTENGKIDKSALPLPDAVRPAIESGYVAPRSDIELMLANIWSEVLSIEMIGVYDKFLELGGNSLSAIRVISRANEAFELELPVNLAFNKPTIAAFAEYIRETIVKLMEED